MILLGKNPGIVPAHANVEIAKEIENNDYVVADALRRTAISHIAVPDSPADDDKTDSNVPDLLHTFLLPTCK